ncbi:unnamed protein product, partial [Urochloa humidicola]
DANACTSAPQVLDPKARKRVRDRARVATRSAEMSEEERKEINKKRREAYHAKTSEEISTRRAHERVKNSTPKQKQLRKDNKRRLKENRANNLHPASIAKPSPHWTPELIDPASSNAKPISSHDWVIPDFSGTPTPIYFPPPADQSPTVETPELRAARTIHRHRVTPGKRTSLRTRQNRIFEETIARDTKGVHNEDCIGTDDSPRSDVIENGVAGLDAQKPNPCDRDAPEINATTDTQAYVVGHGIPNECPPIIHETTNTGASEAEADCDEHIIFEDDEEEGEGYLFAGQDGEEETDADVDFASDMDDVSEPEVEDPYDGVYANVPSETHMLHPVDNCEFCNAKKFESEPPGFCCR